MCKNVNMIIDVYMYKDYRVSKVLRGFGANSES
jgi:hypothetical protein